MGEENHDLGMMAPGYCVSGDRRETEEPEKENQACSEKQGEAKL